MLLFPFFFLIVWRDEISDALPPEMVQFFFFRKCLFLVLFVLPLFSPGGMGIKEGEMGDTEK